MTYTHDGLDRLEVTVNPTSRRTTNTYDAINRQTLIQKANGTRTSVVFDAADRITSQWEFKSDNSVITGLDYQRDGVGNPTRLREATGRLTTWTYDNDNQLINEPLVGHRWVQYDAHVRSGRQQAGQE